MKTLIPLALVFLALYQAAESVVVQEGEFSFPLEDVKKLKDFLDSDATMKQNRVALGNPKAMCTQPGFPQELQPVCQSKDANASLLRLALVTFQMDSCEICAYVACTGC
ncbi:guanylin-like [Engraulis encrasicolus]|uniref:guanylin-like n=1 Tax=Engraulis encrasicolus TaxID=184585 RepID=UPI002FCF91B8